MPMSPRACSLTGTATDYGVGGGQRGDVGPAIETLDKTLSAEQQRLIYVENSRALLAAKGLA
jgi:hypothetical protein